jgi:hypothetical protein
MPQGGGSGEPEFGQPQFGQPQYGQPQYGQQPPAYGGGPMSGQPISPVNEIETRVTGKRIVQYIVASLSMASSAGCCTTSCIAGTGPRPRS